MTTNKRSIHTLWESDWRRWPKERRRLRDAQQRAALRAEFRAVGLPEGVVESEALRRTVIECPDDDEPRLAYAEWMRAQDHDFAQAISAFLSAQLAVAQAFRRNPRADVTELRRWKGRATVVSTTEFRAGASLRRWFLDELRLLLSEGLVGWPQVYRGFVERVAMRAGRFVENAGELFSLAPIRHLILTGVPQAVAQLAACPHLSRIRSLSLPQYSAEDELTDELLAQLLASPYLGNLAHLRLVQQRTLTPRAYEQIVTAPTLPRLSCFETYAPAFSSSEPMRETYDPMGRTARMLSRDTTTRVLRARDWITDLERQYGYIPCVHPEEHYSRHYVDIEAVTEHPIALDADVAARRGQPVPAGRAGKAGLP